MAGERVLAVEISLPDVDGVLPHFDLVLVAHIGRAQVGELDLRGVEAPLGKPEGNLIGLRVDVEQRIADFDLLPFDDVNGHDRPGDLRGDEHLIGADVGVIGRDVASAVEPPGEAERQGEQRDDEEHDGARRP